jgi:hydrophobe/amphiphile efflux-1 (HAE1) family protein
MYRLPIDRPIAGVLFAVGLLVFGVASYLGLPVAALPDIDYPTIMVEAYLAGASPETMASSVAAPIERQLGKVRGITSLSSNSFRGGSIIQVKLSLNRDLGEAATEVQSAIAASSADLPGDMTGPPFWYFDNPSDYSVLAIGLTSKSLPLTRVDDFADTIIARRASEIPGVRSVIDWARQYSAVRVEANPAALAARGLSLEDLRHAIENASSNQPKGAVDGGTLNQNVTANDQLFGAEDWRRVVVAWRNGAPVRLGDVAEVTDGPEYEEDAGWLDGERAVELAFKRAPGANIVQAVDNIRARLPIFNAQMPPGIETHVLLDRSISIRRAVHEVGLTLAFTVALVVLVIYAFLRDARATAIPAIAIPLSLCATFVVMFVLGYSLDNLSLMALAISVGFVVDDAIVVIENIARRVEMGEPPRVAAYEGVRQVGSTILTITLSLAAVFIPVLFMPGVVGRLFREFGVTTSAAILVSGLVSLFLTPMMCARLLKSESFVHKRSGLADLLLARYAASLDWALRHRAVVMACFALTLAVTIWLYVVTPKGFFPPQDTGRIGGSLITRADLSTDAKRDVAAHVAAILRADPDVAHVLFSSGLDFTISLKDDSERSGTMEQVLARLRAKTASIPGARFYLQPQSELVLGGGFIGGHAEYQYTLADASSDELGQWVPKLEAALQHLPQLRDVATDDAQLGTDIRVDIDRDHASSLGVKIADIDQTLYDAFGRRRIREVYTDSKQYWVTLRTTPDFRMDEAALDKLYVGTDSGGEVPLAAFATAKIDRTPLNVKHLGQLPAASIGFNLRPGVALGDAVDAIHAAERSLGKPVTLQTAFDGSAGEFERSLKAEPWLIAAAVLVVYIVLGMLYESLLLPLTILSTLPSAGIGALLLLTACGYDLSVIAVIGILLLIGIVKKNAIMMADFAMQAERAGKTPEAAIREACLTRFRPIMMTTVAALVGSLPLALGHGPGFELRRPLGLAIVGGLMLSQFLTLYTTPVIYLAIGRLGRRARVARIGFARRFHLTTQGMAAED